MKRLFFSALLVISLLSLTGCDFIDSLSIDRSENDVTEEKEVESVRLQEAPLNQGFLIDEFEVDTLTMVVTYNDETVRLRPLNETYFDQTDLELLNERGLHSLSFTYEMITYDFEIKLFETKTEQLLYAFYQSQSPDDLAFDGWVESLDGTDNLDKLSYTLFSIIETHFEEEEEKALVRFYDDKKLIDFDILPVGETVTPPDLEKEGYTFIGWSETDFTVESSKRIEAEFEKNTYTIEFEGTQESLNTIDIPFGESIQLIKPTHESAVFLGWYLDEDYNTPFNYNDMPDQDLVLHARWLHLDAYDHGEEDDEDNGESRESMIQNVSDGVLGIQNIQNGALSGTGSGAIYKYENGHYYVFTNYHVVNEADHVDITFEKNGNAFVFESVEVIGTYEGADIAILRFESQLDFTVLEFRDSFEVLPGMRVYAIGSPQGFQYFNSVTEGIISKTDVLTTAQDIAIDAYFFQHDAAINPGNSGGVLIDEEGYIVGMNTLKKVGEDIEGMGYALKSNIITRMAFQLETEGEITRALIGITSADILECEAFFGACVDSVSEGGTAQALGIEANDLITGIKTDTMDDYLEIANFNRFRMIILTMLPGDNVSLQYNRNDDTFTTDYHPLNE